MFFVGGNTQPQSQENVTPGESPANPSIQNFISHRSSSASLSPPLHQINRQRGVTSPPHILSRPLTSPPPLIPSPARDPEKSKHLSKEFAKSQTPRDDERGRLSSADRNRQKSSRDQELRDADKGQVSSQDQAIKDSEKNPSSRELQKDSDKCEVSGREPEKRTSLSKDLDHKESERGKLRDSEKGRQLNRGADKGRHGSRDPIHRESNKSKSFPRDPSNKEVENSRSLSKEAGLTEPDKHKQYNKETGKDSGQVKDRLSSKDTDRSRPPSRDFSNRSTERNKDSGKDRNTGTQFKQAGDEAKNPGLVPASSGQYSPPVGTAALTGQQRVGGTKHTDKQGKHGGKDQDDSMSPTLIPRHRLNSYSTQSTGNVMQASFHKDSVAGKTGSPQSSKSSARKSNDYLPGPVTAAALKPLWPSWTPAEEDVVKQGSMHSASPAASLAKEKQPKVKTAGSREVSKDREREKTLQNNSKNSLLNNNTKTTGSFSTNAINTSSNNGSKSRVAVLGNSIKAHGNAQGEKLENQGGDRSSSKNRENYHSSERRNSSGVDNMQQSSSAAEREVKTDSESHTKPTTNPLPLSSREKRKSVKLPTVTTLKAEMKLDPNGTSTVGGISSSSSTVTPTSTISPASQGTCRSALATLYSPSGSSSDGSESDTQTPTEGDLRTKHLHIKHRDHHSLLTHAIEDEGDGPENDHDRAMDDKHLEDDSDGSGSAKRRYPRRSARARSNMFFGLTPFYGVRSYGEEDLPFYGSGDSAGALVKRRTGIRKKSAEGQVDGADDMSSTSSGDSGEDEDDEIKQSRKNRFYSSFTRTIINPGDGLPSIEGIDQCVGRGSQLQRFLKDEAQQQQRAQGKTEEDLLNAL